MNIKKYITTNNLVLLLVFLFPIAGTFVRHWISDILGILFFVSLYFYFTNRRTSLYPEEKKWLWSLAIYFAVFLLTAFVNEWTDEQTTWLGLEIRFLLIIPIYLMLREIKNVEWAFFYGLAMGLVAVSIWGGYEFFQSGSGAPLRISGIYSPLFIGPVTLLMAALVVAYLIYNYARNKQINLYIVILCIFAIGTSLVVVVLSGARSAYLGFFVLAGVYFLYYIRNRKTIIYLSMTIIGFTTVALNIEFVKVRITAAQQQTQAYFQAEDNQTSNNLEESSMGIRFEMWRGSWYLIKASPVFGVGRGNYNQAMQEYIDAGLVNPAVNNHSHPHNAFVETTVSRGVLGLLIMLFILYYPLYVFFITRKESPITSLMGITHVVLITSFSMTETATFIKGNFVAINLVLFSLLFSFHLREINKEHKAVD